MMITKSKLSKNKEKAKILLGEILGEKLTVIKSTCPELVGLSGIVVDETMNTFKIETIKKEEKIIPKKCCIFEISGVVIDGSEILYRPEDRLKKLWRKYYGVLQG
ncbi:MAG: ribonuclease P protein subunit [archaeon]